MSAPRAACAFPDAASRGRRHAEPAHPYRGEFQRDRDRIIHARAFRRLENKTQVFAPSFSDHFRNRLTHTLEVAQISRTVAGAVGLNADLVEALALVHDIGHAPFGHAGERALDAALQSHGERFDHNLQALRIVEELEQRYPAFSGLNLTFEVREGIVKHSGRYSERDHPALAEYGLAAWPPLEAQIIDLTDELAYLCADLDDGFEARLLAWEEIRAGVPLFDGLAAEVDREYAAASGKQRFNEALRRLLDVFVSDLVAELRRRLPALPSVEAVRSAAAPQVALSGPVEAGRAGLKAYLYRALYRHPRLQEENTAAARIVSETFGYFLRRPAALPSGYREPERRGNASLARVVCDYLAGMTDSYIQRVHGAMVAQGGTQVR